MELRFENELGSIVMSGGGSGEIRITSINGLGVPAYERRLLTSYDFDGAAESARRMPVRSITVSGDLTGGREQAALLSRILSQPCVMAVICDVFEREVKVSAAEAVFSDKTRSFIKFALSLTCDDPYFYDYAETRKGLFTRERLITEDTVLPSVFSTRSEETEIVVSGDRAVEPTIVICGGVKKEGDSGSVVIENTTSGKSFTLEYIPAENEIITIDVAARTVTSDIAGNIIGCISDDSFLSDLVIEQGTAALRTVGYGATGSMNAYIVYKNKYIEAMV